MWAAVVGLVCMLYSDSCYGSNKHKACIWAWNSTMLVYSMYLVNIHSRWHIGEEIFVTEKFADAFFHFRFTQTLNACKVDSFIKSLVRISVIRSHPLREIDQNVLSIFFILINSDMVLSPIFNTVILIPVLTCLIGRYTVGECGLTEETPPVLSKTSPPGCLLLLADRHAGRPGALGQLPKRGHQEELHSVTPWSLHFIIHSPGEGKCLPADTASKSGLML